MVVIRDGKTDWLRQYITARFDLEKAQARITELEVKVTMAEAILNAIPNGKSLVRAMHRAAEKDGE